MSVSTAAESVSKNGHEEGAVMKIRIKFQKQGTVRFIGHLDVMRYFQNSESTCTGKGGTTHGADRQADTDLRPQSG